MENHKQERRRAVRIKKSFFVQYSDNAASWDMGLVKDISEVGICMITGAMFAVNTQLSLRFKLPTNLREVMRISGRVVDSKKRSDKFSMESSISGCLTKIEFIDLNQKQEESIRIYLASSIFKDSSLCNEKAEKRGSRRINKRLTIQYENAPAYKWDISAVTSLSETGMCVATSESFLPDTILRFRLKLPSSPFQAIEIGGRVVSSQKNTFSKTKGTSYLTRIEIVNLHPEGKDLIIHYINWFFAKKLDKQKEGGVK